MSGRRQGDNLNFKLECIEAPLLIIFSTVVTFEKPERDTTMYWIHKKGQIDWRGTEISLLQNEAPKTKNPVLNTHLQPKLRPVNSTYIAHVD